MTARPVRALLTDGEVSGTVTVAAASIDTGNTRRDAHLRSADFGLTWNWIGMASVNNTLTIHAVLTHR
jgi:hypothetical protein